MPIETPPVVSPRVMPIDPKDTQAIRFRKEFGRRLRHERHKRGVTLEALAKKCGTHKGYICGMETGKVAPCRPPMLRKIMRALGVEAEPFLALRQLSDIPPDLTLGAIRDLIYAAEYADGGRA